MATYIIGDVHGCFDALMRLLDKVNYDSRFDQLGFTGDLINRGPQSLKTLRFVASLKDPYVVLGNHDISALAQASGALPILSQDLQPLMEAEDKDILFNWLRKQPLLRYPIQDFALVHAGIPPQWSIEKAIEHSHEVEQHLQGNHLASFLKSIWSNTPTAWEACRTDTERHRYTVNALTRMRFCTQTGQLDLDNKNILHENLQFQPWFHWSHTAPTPIIFGHWATLKGKCTAKEHYALDTAYVYGGKLSALRLEDKQLFTLSAPQ